MPYRFPTRIESADECERLSHSFIGEQLNSLRGRNDRDVLVLSAQVEQMLVAGDDQLGIGGAGASEHLIIVRVIEYDTWHDGRLHDDGDIQKTSEQIIQRHAAAPDGTGKLRGI